MTPEQVFATVAALLSAETDPAFDTLRNGGYDDRYPVAVSACPETTSVLEVDGSTILCGTVSVPENHEEPEGNRIPVRFSLMKSRSQSPMPDPVTYLHGGPGAGTLSSLALVSDILFAKHRASRDIVTFDQRAAGLTSSTVQCTTELADRFVDLVRESVGGEGGSMEDLVGSCITELYEGEADLAQYNTPNNARDVRAIMSALGYPEYNIVGISYGTRLALEVMRTAPEGVRSVVIDSVAPTTVRLYDDLLGPHRDTIDAIVDQCAQDSACAEAYPDLKQDLIALGEKLGSDPVPAGRGAPEISADFFGKVVGTRNKIGVAPDLTGYVPRITAELLEGDTSTFDWYLNRDMSPDPETVLRGAGPQFRDDERALALAALEAALSMTDLGESIAATLKQLKHDIVTHRAALSVAEAFEARSNEALQAMTDRDEVTALVTDYARLQQVPPSREALADWVAEYFSGADRRALLDLIRAMSDEDLLRTWEIGAGEVTKYEAAASGNFNLMIYACQEDFPWNSRRGYDEITSGIEYAFLLPADPEEGIGGLYEACSLFTPVENPGFHEPVVSDIPTLVMAGLNDTQTSWKWAPLAAESLSNAQELIFPEAGHGAMAFSDCANDITVTFISDPETDLDTSCIASLKPEFVLPDAPLGR